MKRESRHRAHLYAISLGLLASAFFAFTFVLNRQMQVQGGSWVWSASLRYFFMLPILFLLLLPRRRYRVVTTEIRLKPLTWLLWSSVGFGVFYALVSFAASYGPSWLVACTWQITIVAGIILTPLARTTADPAVRHRIPGRELVVSLIIFAGVLLVQGQVSSEGFGTAEALCVASIVVAAFAYPLGNRKMMGIVPAGMGTLERVFGMTLASMPFWIVLAVFGAASTPLPSGAQIIQSLAVAVFSGVCATLLFFKATNIVRHDPRTLAAVESTQAGEVVFSLAGGALFFGDNLPAATSAVGIALVVAGILGNALARRH